MPISASPARLSMPKADYQRAKWLIFFLIVPLIVAADQLTKSWIRSYPEGSTIYEAGLLRIVNIENTGAAFGLFQAHSTLLMFIDFLAIALILAYFLILSRRFRFFTSPVGWIGLSLIFAGTSGNLIDRLNPGIRGITDFLYIGIWPAFNVADSAITVGVILLVYSLLFVKVKSESS